MELNSIVPASLEQYRLNSGPVADKADELGQDEFLTLMLAQIKHQDPMEPMANGEFISELAEFSTVSGIEDMNTSLQELTSAYGTSQTMASAQLVGQEVLIENNALTLDEEGETGGRFELEYASGNVTAVISNERGELVRELELGSFSAGRHNFSWDGFNAKGDRAIAGPYSIAINARSGEDVIAAPVLSSRIVDAVEFGAGGTTRLFSSNGDEFTLNDVRQIRQAQPFQETMTGNDS